MYQKVRSYLVENGIEPQSVAKNIGMASSTFDAILDGNATLYADDLQKICYALNVSPEEFIMITKEECK